MRIIAGEAKGKTIKTLRGLEVRPTSDLVREALFAILGPRVEGAVFLDLFAGSGSVGIEALSRGAQETIFVDENPQCIRILKENLIRTGLEKRSRIYKTESLHFLVSSQLKPKTIDIIFIDPPYGDDLARKALKLVEERGILAEGAWAVVEHFHKTTLAGAVKNLKLFKERRFGATKLSFYIHHYQPSKQEVREEE